MKSWTEKEALSRPLICLSSLAVVPQVDTIIYLSSYWYLKYPWLKVVFGHFFVEYSQLYCTHWTDWIQPTILWSMLNTATYIVHREYSQLYRQQYVMFMVA